MGQFTYPMYTVWTADSDGYFNIDNDFQNLDEAFKFFDSTTGPAKINIHNSYESAPSTLVERE